MELVWVEKSHNTNCWTSLIAFFFIKQEIKNQLEPGKYKIKVCAIKAKNAEWYCASVYYIKPKTENHNWIELTLFSDESYS